MPFGRTATGQGLPCRRGSLPRLVSAIARSQDRSLVAFVSLRSTAMLARSQRVRPWAIGRTRETVHSSQRSTNPPGSSPSGLVHEERSLALRTLAVRLVPTHARSQVGSPSGGGRTDLRSLPRLRLVKTLAPQLARTTIHRIIVLRSSAPSHEPRIASVATACSLCERSLTETGNFASQSKPFGFPSMLGSVPSRICARTVTRARCLSPGSCPDAFSPAPPEWMSPSRYARVVSPTRSARTAQLLRIHSGRYLLRSPV